MDKHNLFFTRSTYNFVRLDYLVVLIALAALVLANWSEVNWLRFVIAFLWSDLIGTFPGLYWYHKRTTATDRRVPPVFYLLYNFGHSFTAVAMILGGWYLVNGQLEWAMLAMPIHLLGDRAIFGNIYKATGLEFEPAPNPAFVRFMEQYEQKEKAA